MRERDIERYFVMKARQQDLMALKFVSPGFAGVPDRLVLMPKGKVVFAEMKAPGEKLRPLQEYRKQQLENLGFKVYVIDGKEQCDEVFTSCVSEICD